MGQRTTAPFVQCDSCKQDEHPIVCRLLRAMPAEQQLRGVDLDPARAGWREQWRRHLRAVSHRTGGGWIRC